jgi:hypothetical protein
MNQSVCWTAELILRQEGVKKREEAQEGEARIEVERGGKNWVTAQKKSGKMKDRKDEKSRTLPLADTK